MGFGSLLPRSLRHEQERDAYGARVAELHRELEAARARIADLERELASRR